MGVQHVGLNYGSLVSRYVLLHDCYCDGKAGLLSWQVLFNIQINECLCSECYIWQDIFDCVLICLTWCTRTSLRTTQL